MFLTPPWACRVLLLGELGGNQVEYDPNLGNHAVCLKQTHLLGEELCRVSKNSFWGMQDEKNFSVRIFLVI